MEQMVKELYEAAIEGNPATLLDLLQQDVLILDRCIVTSYEETPLHIAAMLGHLEFCSELVRRKPELAAELDFRRSSALHLASAKGYMEIVKILLSVKPEMCLAYDGDGYNPIHVAAIKGRVDVLKTLARIHPDAARAKVRMHQGENVLHLCVQYYHLEALMCLVDSMNDQEFVNTRDDNGNSILHLAMVDKQVEIIQYLLSRTPIDIDAVNSSGFTPLDILAQTRRDSKYLDISQCLQHSRAKKSQEIHSYVPIGRHQRVTAPKETEEEPSTDGNSYLNKQSVWLEKQRHSIMVVASLIATMAFQATFAPPGGFWQENFKGDNSTSEAPHKAGDSILAYQHPKIYNRFMLSNAIGFISSLSVILLLISGLPFMRKTLMWLLMLIMWISITATAYTFLISVADNPSAAKRILDYSIDIWIMMMALLIIVHTVRFEALKMSGWHLKFKISVWTFTLLVWISVSAYLISLGGTLLVVAPLGFMILIVALILVHSVTLLSLVVRKTKICIKGLRGCFSSNPPVSTEV
ncbi:homeodomain transcription factor [Lithospermum erythrorhizon]|uniref:Homeodomain transcription factor n=1 Tax=Lithospermum erythrorhizon TaxID=34254 RepID=A0AAV3R2B3_LITER